MRPIAENTGPTAAAAAGGPDANEQLAGLRGALATRYRRVHEQDIGPQLTEPAADAGRCGKANRAHLRPHRALSECSDKAASEANRVNYLGRRSIKITIPERDDQKAGRARRGSVGGRPRTFDSQAYKGRNVVERCFNRLKQWRGIATRYDKTARSYLGGVTLAAALIWIKSAV